MIQVEEAPSSVYYYSNYISEESEKSILDSVYNAPKPKWTQLSGRRLQNWGGLPHPKGMIKEPLPNWLDSQIDRISSFELFDGKTPNHVLVNEYLPGQGIMPHVDGPLFHPSIATITLGSYTFLDFYHTRKHDEDIQDGNSTGRKVFSLLLERRSLVILRDDVYTDYLHGINEVMNDRLNSSVLNAAYCKSMSLENKTNEFEREKRVSLTIRHVPKVLNVKLKLFNNR